ncbi:S41 family peptidase [uncultured Maribacter sp.]|uniref:S41 family peptidase n=1 Tax=uncultured Maribacter sp. TaxID=431308 RepID=UPI002636CD7C|nr:S41 family peptidase [uncultured Maribacter sp.]
MKKYFLLFLTIGILFNSCNNDDNATPIEESKKKPEEIPVVKLVTDYPVQNFIWKAMNSYYFWQGDVSDLADNRFASENDYIDYLSKNSNPEEFFYKICNNHAQIIGNEAATDRFSFVSENYEDLVSGFAGIFKSNGLEFGLLRFSDSDDVFGYVTYIIPNSNAATKDIKRGDLFTGVNGTTITTSNYRDLLFGTNDSYTLNMADINDNVISSNNKSVDLTKEENLQEDPILVKKVIEHNGLKIGYLMYNSFIANYDEQLNDVFGDFKAENIDDLILDFRYNGGGRVSSAIQIASSVYGTETEDLFLKARYNDKIQASLNTGQGESNFIDKTLGGSQINTLNLNRVYIITSGSTASASELVINGLEPYIDVIQIGTNTVGKNEFSNTFVDDIENNYFYSPEREDKINPDNQWAIQPLLGRNENADGFSDYTSGLIPDYELFEDIANLGVLGETNEPLLEFALNTISGTSSKIDFTPKYPAKLMGSSIEAKPMNNLMLMDGLLKPIAFE